MNQKFRILLVDDDPDFIDINRTILESNGYEVDAAYTSDDALEKLKSLHFDLLIVDLMMEDRDSGFTIAYAVRENEKLQSLPILMLTSAEQKTGFKFQLSKDQEWMKVDDFAAKPLRPAELILRVKALLNKDS
ncbi:response regulator [candidate division KSB1 bacterium]|nr:response regulator [candidate division KSB1 bacterium]